MSESCTNTAQVPTLVGRKFIVSGGASGLGAAAVRAFVAEGALVAVVDIDASRGNAIVDQLGDTAIFRVCDVREAEQVRRTFDELVTDEFEELDGLVHCSGIHSLMPAESISLEEWDRIIGVNALGTVLTNQSAFRHLKKRGGCIINFASAAGVRGAEGQACYAASKGAVLAWTRSVAREWAQWNVTVNAVIPQAWTPLYDQYRAKLSPEELASHDKIKAQEIPLGGRLGHPDNDIAPALVFLAGNGARFITGQTIALDGGHTMLGS